MRRLWLQGRSLHANRTLTRLAAGPSTTPRLRVRNATTAGLLNLLLTIGNQGRPLNSVDIEGITNRMRAKDDIHSPQAISAAAVAISETPRTSDNVSSIDCYIRELTFQLSRLNSSMTSAQIIKCLSALKCAPSALSHEWEGYASSLSSHIELLCAAPCGQVHLSPSQAAKMLNCFQFVSSVIPSADECSGETDLPGSATTVLRLLAAVARLIRGQLSGRNVLGSDIVTALIGLRGMSNLHSEVREALLVVKNMLARKRRSHVLNGHQLAVSMSTLYNMNVKFDSFECGPGMEPTDSGTPLHSILAVLCGSFRNVPEEELCLTDIALAFTALPALLPSHPTVAVQFLTSVSTGGAYSIQAPRRHVDESRHVLSTEPMNPLGAMCCVLYCSADIPVDSHEADLDEFFSKLGRIYLQQKQETLGVQWTGTPQHPVLQLFTDPIQSICLGIYGLRSQNGISGSVCRLLRILGDELASHMQEEDLNLSVDAEHVTMALMGLGNMSGDSWEALDLLSSLGQLVKACPPMGGEELTLCLRSLSNKSMEHDAVRQVLRAIGDHAIGAQAAELLEVSDSAIAIGFSGLSGKPAQEEVTFIVSALTTLLERNLVEGRETLHVNDDVLILNALSGMSADSDAVRRLLSVVTTRLERQEAFINNAGAARAIFGLQCMSNATREVQFLMSTLANKCFVRHPDNSVFTSADIALFLTGLSSVKGGLGDEVVLEDLLRKALDSMLQTPRLAMSSADLTVCVRCLDALSSSMTQTSLPADEGREVGDIVHDICLIIEAIRQAVIDRHERGSS